MPRLDENGFHVIGVNDPGLLDLIVQGFPEICNSDGVSRFQLVDVQEIRRAVPAPVARKNTVGVAAANGNAGAGEDTLQREANRLLGYTAKQTLDYAQSLYEKKLLIWTVFFGRSWKNAPPSGIG